MHTVGKDEYMKVMVNIFKLFLLIFVFMVGGHSAFLR